MNCKADIKKELDIVSLDMKFSQQSFHALLAEIFDDKGWLQDILDESRNVQSVADQQSNLTSLKSTENDLEKTLVAEGCMPKNESMVCGNLQIMPLHPDDIHPDITDLEETILISSEHVSGMMSSR